MVVFKVYFLTQGKLKRAHLRCKSVSEGLADLSHQTALAEHLADALQLPVSTPVLFIVTDKDVRHA